MLLYSEQILLQTLQHLRDGGATGIETVVLWLGNVKENGELKILEVFRPDQTAAADRFNISANSMRNLMKYLRQTRTKILAQVHSHPNEAFHSRADDEWAIIRHTGAVSLVIPDFAKNTTENNFQDKVAAYQLSSSNIWQQVKFNSIAKDYQC